MPDSTNSPGDPAVLRDAKRRTSEQGAGAARRIPPGQTSAAAAGAARPRTSTHGVVARAERGGTRWRDIQWVDFTSEADSGTAPEPEPALVRAATPPEPAPPAPPRLGNFLRRFDAPSAETHDRQSDTIPGLRSRFTRLPVARLLSVPAQPAPLRPDPARQAASRPVAAPPVQAPQAPAPPARRTEPPPAATMPKTGSVVVHPRHLTPVEIAAPEPPPREPVVRELPAREASDHRAFAGEPPGDEALFPASITTPVSAGSYSGPVSRGRWRAALGERAVIVGVVLRGASGGVAARVAGGLAQARGRLPTLRRRLAPAPQPAAEPRPATRLSLAIDTLSRYVAARENRLRVTGLATLAAVFIAVAAYVGGALLARVAGTSRGATSSPPASAVGKQPATADKVVRPPPAALSAPPPAANAPPADPAARAAFYMARAKAGEAAAQYDVGVLYARGDGLVQDLASAATWFHAAAAQGNVAAEYNLGVMYQRGLGVAADETEALNWYRSAADQNHPGAQFNLALAYAGGNGTKQDLAAAARWYKRAAEQGLPPAMVNLAILYEGGKGVERSLVDAYAWYSAAGERGDTGAKTRAGELFQQFNDKDKARAQGLAATIGAALDQAQATPPPPA